MVFLLIAGRNWAQNNEANVQFHSFQDTRGVTVLSPTADYGTDITERTNLRVNLGVDAISAASDSCARCHRSGVNSHRLGGGLSLTRKLDSFKLSVGGAYSQENFYRSTTLLTSASRDLANGNATVAGGYSFSLNQPVLHPTQQVENQYAHDAFVSVTQTLSKATIAQIGYELGRITGFQNNPFLRATEMIRDLPHPEKPGMRSLANPIKVDGKRLEQSVCSALGADNDAYLADTSLAKRAAIS